MKVTSFKHFLKNLCYTIFHQNFCILRQCTNVSTSHIKTDIIYSQKCKSHSHTSSHYICHKFFSELAFVRKIPIKIKIKFYLPDIKCSLLNFSQKVGELKYLPVIPKLSQFTQLGFCGLANSAKFWQMCREKWKMNIGAREMASTLIICTPQLEFPYCLHAKSVQSILKRQ